MEKIEINKFGILKHLLYYRTISKDEYVDIEDIKYCSGCPSKSITNIFTENQENPQPPYHSLSEVEKVINKNYFQRSHKSWLVNFKKVECLNKSERMIIMKDGCKIPVSRGKMQEVVQKSIENKIPIKKFKGKNIL